MKRDPTSRPQQAGLGKPSRRTALGLIAASAGGLVAASSGMAAFAAQSENQTLTKETPMHPEAFVYTEVQISVPFNQAPWQNINASIRKQPGFLNKTWLSGVKTNSLGGIYAFDSVANAEKFVTGYFPAEAGGFGAAHNTRVFDASIVEEASLGLRSPHFGASIPRRPGAFVYTEVQVNLPFDKAPWKARNPVLEQQPGLICKTWLSGLHTNTIGGIDAFDTLENATRFALEDFPKTAAGLNAAFYTRIFDAAVTEEASRDMFSPYYV